MSDERYVGAYRFSGQHPLDDELRATLQRAQRSMFGRIGIGFLVASSVFWLLIPLDIWLLRPADVPFPTWLVAVWLVVMLLAMGYMSVCAANYGFAGRALRAGFSERFELPADVAGEVRAQRAIGALRPEVVVAESLDILPRPPLVVRIDGQPTPLRRVRVKRKPPVPAEPLAGCLMRPVGQGTGR